MGVQEEVELRGRADGGVDAGPGHDVARLVLVI